MLMGELKVIDIVFLFKMGSLNFQYHLISMVQSSSNYISKVIKEKGTGDMHLYVKYIVVQFVQR